MSEAIFGNNVISPYLLIQGLAFKYKVKIMTICFPEILYVELQEAYCKDDLR